MERVSVGYCVTHCVCPFGLAIYRNLLGQPAAVPIAETNTTRQDAELLTKTGHRSAAGLCNRMQEH